MSSDMYRVTDHAVDGQTTFEVLEYEALRGHEPPGAAARVFELNRSGARLRQLHVQLHGTAVRLEPGALQFMRGAITIENAASARGAAPGGRGVVRSALGAVLTGETINKPRYTGRGAIWCEPTFGHPFLITLEREAVVLDHGIFLACSDALAIETVRNGVVAGLAGGEGLFQTKVEGTGVLAVALPVPQDELLELELADEALQVDGPFAVMRTAGVAFSVERSAKGLLGSARTGEGFLQTFRGTGKVWLAPTQPVYERLAGPPLVLPRA